MADPECAIARIDPLQLAWAAGFFDGEGSTLVHEQRPGYLRLTVSVPQSGGPEPPEVLLRFQRAVLGLGEVERSNNDGMWVWRSRSAEEGQAAIALLWPHLGSVKRAQAVSAVRRLHAQYGPGGFKPRRPRRTRRMHDVHADPPSVGASPEDAAVAWAAGFLDAEGHFGSPRGTSRKTAPAWRRIRVSAPQHSDPAGPAEVLLRMQRILGGRIERHGDPDDFRWIVEGERVETLIVLVRPWLGTVKQGQARRALETYRAQVRLHGDAERCARGHSYDRVYQTSTGSKKRCNSCARLLSRRKRAANGIKPRQFRNAARRYTS